MGSLTIQPQLQPKIITIPKHKLAEMQRIVICIQNQSFSMPVFPVFWFVVLIFGLHFYAWSLQQLDDCSRGGDPVVIFWKELWDVTTEIRCYWHLDSRTS